MSRHRLLVPTAALSEDVPGLPAAAARHLKVIRPKAGEEIELFDGRGASRVFRYDAAARALKSAAEFPLVQCGRGPRFTLFACVTKGSRWDWTIEKATELGVGRIVPVISERTIVRVTAAERPAKRERWLRIAEEAARQSDAKWVPEIVGPVDFAAALELAKATTCLVGALTEPPPPPIAAALSGLKAARELSVFVGPEGDFSSDELRALTAIGVPVSFGSTILRAETAAIFGVGAIKAWLDVSAG